MLSAVEFKADVASYLEKSLCNDKAFELLGVEECRHRFEELLSCLAIPPSYTTLRFNTTKQSDAELVIAELSNLLKKQYSLMSRDCPQISVHPLIKDCLLIENEGPLQHNRMDKEVMVDVCCAGSVLRGANIFVQGVLAASPGMQVGDCVSVFADIDHQCRRGFVKIFEGRKIFLGNGIAKYSRDEIFSSNTLSGVGIEMCEPLFIAPSLSDLDPSLFFPQNLPSIICSHVLNPQPGDLLLDMCAAPGSQLSLCVTNFIHRQATILQRKLNLSTLWGLCLCSTKTRKLTAGGKTCHLASLMKNQGRLIALDKSSKKIPSMTENVTRWGLTNVEVYCWDGTKSVNSSADIQGGPPYPCETFDKILLDAPCSGLGQRPMLRCSSSLAEVSSYPPLQRKLFQKAVELLKPGGTLVYSTCTITTEENERLVVWALQTFPNLRLVEQTPYVGSPGWPCEGLTEEQRHLLQRFIPAKYSATPSSCSANRNSCSATPSSCLSNHNSNDKSSNFSSVENHGHIPNDSLHINNVTNCNVNNCSRNINAETTAVTTTISYNNDTIGFFVAKFVKC